MPRCPSCSREVPEGLFCLACGKPLLTSSETPTELLEQAQSPARPPAAPPIPRTAAPTLGSGHGRFLPGALLAGRYRIVALAGRGGMGEVYRADDLKLGQPVALKFLPEDLERDEARLDRFMNEVRTARQVAHPNVCRVYDVGEIDGHHFLSMEYVDGEDLASLLRRIGRVPSDKGVEIARQISAGLAAAHDAGVLHRDLKPANVMIDGRGRARITDFGLAALGAVEAGEEARFGTPAYMSPEQLDGKDVTMRSDIYALGLVLYELFTGKPPYKASSRSQLRELQTSASPASPSSLVGGLDPAVERVILRCLEPEPSRRPASALAVMAALPGGDPLAAAIAAGETPSPELVAAAGEASGWTPMAAVATTAAILAGLALAVILAAQTQLARLVPMEKPPAVLTEKAREILRGLGYEEPPVDSISAFEVDDAGLEELRRGAGGSEVGQVVRRHRPAALLFRYRQSPSHLVRMHAAAVGNWFTDPPPTLPGMAEVSLDPDGRLVALLVVPPDRLPPAGTSPEPDWSRLLSAAGLDGAALEAIEPARAPAAYADRITAWEVREPDGSETRTLVEAAALGGRPVAFRITDPPQALARPDARPEPEHLVGNLLRGIAYFSVIASAIFLAQRNLRQGRGDAKGAIRFAVYLGIMRLLWMIGEHHVPTAAEIDLIAANVSWSMYRVLMAALLYLAIEPYARRLWPRMLVSWTRLLHGGLRDPLVGRDVLVGCALGVVWGLASHVFLWVTPRLGLESAPPLISRWGLEALRGVRHAVAAVLALHTTAILEIFVPLTLFLFIKLLTKRTWIGFVIVSMLGTAIFYPGSGSLPLYVAMMTLIMITFWTALFRFGFLSIMVGTCIADLLRWMPLTFDPSAPYAGASILTLAVVAGLALFAFRASLAGRPLFRDTVLGTEPAR